MLDDPGGGVLALELGMVIMYLATSQRRIARHRALLIFFARLDFDNVARAAKLDVEVGGLVARSWDRRNGSALILQN